MVMPHLMTHGYKGNVPDIILTVGCEYDNAMFDDT